MTYKTKGVCSREINFEVEDNKVKNVQSSAALRQHHRALPPIDGMDIDEAISRIEGISVASANFLPGQLAPGVEGV